MRLNFHHWQRKRAKRVSFNCERLLDLGGSARLNGSATIKSLRCWTVYEPRAFILREIGRGSKTEKLEDHRVIPISSIPWDWVRRREKSKCF